MSKRQEPIYHRSLETILEHLAYTGSGLGGVEGESQRHEAIAEVMMRLPPAPYEALEEAVDRFSWFIPHDGMHGGVWPFGGVQEEPLEGGLTRQYATVVYLSPLLERRSFAFTVGVVAHELAHVILGHSPYPRDYEAQEAEANAALEEWGFGREWRVHEAFIRRRERDWQRRVEAWKARHQAA